MAGVPVRKEFLPWRGVVETRELACPRPVVQPGQVFLPMHCDAVNRLTAAEFDPHSRQPSYKACAVARQKCQKLPGMQYASGAGWSGGGVAGGLASG